MSKGGKVIDEAKAAESKKEAKKETLSKKKISKK
jgi:hypothetical protein